MDGPIVWEDALDERYRVRVIERDDDKQDATPHLQIFLGETLIYDQITSLAFGAIFGPDSADVAIWKEIAARFVDTYEGAATL